MRPLRSVLEAVSHADARGRLAERAAAQLREQLPEDHVVLARYAPRDRGDRIALVIIGRDRLFVVEPRDEDGDLVCYQDHWYRRSGPNAAHPLADPPSLRARRNAERVRIDLGTGGFLNVRIEPLVVLTRARPDDVRSSCVSVIAGLDALVRYMLRSAPGDAAPERTHALASALAHNITVATG
jgi:hypothetical protein